MWTNDGGSDGDQTQNLRLDNSVHENLRNDLLNLNFNTSSSDYFNNNLKPPRAVENDQSVPLFMRMDPCVLTYGLQVIHIDATTAFVRLKSIPMVMRLTQLH
jgi:hypothetical protein